VRRLRVLDVHEVEILRFCFKKVTFNPYLFKYVFMLLVLCLVIVASLVTL
jgi:hypothetical protein